MLQEENCFKCHYFKLIDAHGTLERLARHKDTENVGKSGINRQSMKLQIEWWCTRVSIMNICRKKGVRWSQEWGLLNQDEGLWGKPFFPANIHERNSIAMPFDL